jgi:hypothetical protein
VARGLSTFSYFRTVEMLMLTIADVLVALPMYWTGAASIVEVSRTKLSRLVSETQRVSQRCEVYTLRVTEKCRTATG